MEENNQQQEKPKRKKKSKLGKRILRWFALNVAPPIAYQWMKWFDRTALKDNEKLLTLIGHEDLLDHIRGRKGPVIVCLWHNRLMFGPTAYQYCHGPGAYIMVSRSFDGDVIAAVLDRFKNLHAVRGSSSKKGKDKGGQDALAELIEIAKKGFDLTITPDGPQGPRYVVKRGIIELAKATGLPIYPGTANCDRVIVARSWDQTRVPFPNARFVYKVGEKIEVPPDADDELMEQKRKQLEEVMIEMTEFVDAFYGDEQKIHRL